jgi:hypothetical protein
VGEGGGARHAARKDGGADGAALWGGEGEGRGACVGACTRHHAIDWNFVGVGRPRPNKWWVQPTPESMRTPSGGEGEGHAEGRVKRARWDAGEQGAAARMDDWLELSYASDDSGAPYYWERWTRYEGGACGGGGGGQVPATVALRASLVAQEEVAQGAHATAATLVARDALLVVAGDHFNYVVQRPVPWERLAPLGGSCAAVVDAAITQGDRALAEACVLLEAGHGRVSSGWVVDASLQPWRIGQPLAAVFGGDKGGRGQPSSSPPVPTLAEALTSGAVGARVRVGHQIFDRLG